MKKLLLLLFLIPLISCTEDGTGEKGVPLLQERNGIQYEVNSEVGFTGKYVEYFKNGQKLIEKDYKNGKLEGLVTEWHENGQKKSEIKTKNGKVVDGLQTSWYENGQKETEVNWKNDKLEGLQTSWYENGQKETEVNYKNGKAEGLSITWHDNGQKEVEINWKNGEVVDGVVTFWDKEGDVTETETYKDGILVSSNDGLFRNIFENIFLWTF